MMCLCTLGLILAASCTKDFEEMNTNPKIVTAELIDPGLILTYVEWNGVYRQCFKRQWNLRMLLRNVQKR